jgi:zinc D-Ala-D-Ala dipeptidase
MSYILFICWWFAACTSAQEPIAEAAPSNPTIAKLALPAVENKTVAVADTSKKPAAATVPKSYDMRSWTEVNTLIPDLMIDLKYAGTDNFVGTQMYECARLFLRPEVARALYKVQQDLKEKKLQLIVYDGYRPRPIQQKLWDKKPDDNYVTPPWKGSMHNRGMAIDLGLADATGKILDMGTPFDDLSPKSHHTETNLPAEALENRRTLKHAMEHRGFRSIRTEWWHYSFTGPERPLSDWVWDCPEGK